MKIDKKTSIPTFIYELNNFSEIRNWHKITSIFKFTIVALNNEKRRLKTFLDQYSLKNLLKM